MIPTATVKPNRDALRVSYLTAYSVLHDTKDVPRLTYVNGWWVFRNGCLLTRYRTAKLVEMRNTLRDRLRRKEATA